MTTGGFGGRWELATAQLVIWSPKLAEVLDCPLDETTWLDRHLLSAGSDPTLHRSPRCAGVRYMDHGWELFSHDTSHEVYVGPYTGGACPHYEAVRAAAVHVLPVARGQFRPYPVRLENGSWLVSIGKWVVRLHVEGAAPGPGGAGRTGAGKGAATQERRSRPGDSSARGSPPLPGAAERVRAYFERKAVARMAIAYYYQEFIRGAVGPQAVPIVEVAAALDLTGDAAVSEYKKELQRLIWNEQGHQRELAEFLIASGLIGKADLEQASAVAADNERNGKSEAARARFRYRQKKRQDPAAICQN
ncbi:MAG: hypothetical protein ACM3ML_27435 [Micromonosporaceae bacterium]